jgi:hypothetical protein
MPDGNHLETVSGSVLDEATEPQKHAGTQKRKTPELPGVRECEEGDSNPHGS